MFEYEIKQTKNNLKAGEEKIEKKKTEGYLENDCSLNNPG